MHAREEGGRREAGEGSECCQLGSERAGAREGFGEGVVKVLEGAAEMGGGGGLHENIGWGKVGGWKHDRGKNMCQGDKASCASDDGSGLASRALRN